MKHQKVPTPHLEDILESISRIEKYLKEIDGNRDTFNSDFEKQDSIIKRLETIGEATKRLEADFKNQFPEIPWRRLAGMRDILIHEYDQVDLDLVWKTITEDLPPIKNLLSRLLQKITSN